MANLKYLDRYNDSNSTEIFNLVETETLNSAENLVPVVHYL